MSEPVGSIPVLITGDWSDLAAALQQATAAASAGAGQIASAFTSAASGAGGLEAAMNSLANTTKSTQASFYSLQTATAAEGAAALQAAGDLQLMSQQVQQTGGDFAYTSSLMEKMATQLQAMTAASAEATTALKGVAEQAQQTATSTQAGAVGVGDLMSAFAKVTGITIGIAALRSFAESAVEAFAQVERGQIAFTYLTGSATTAAEAMQSFRSISTDLALPFDSVVSFSQQLLAAGVSVNQLGTAITDAADAAAARGTSFDVAASAIERITETGNVSSKVLRQLGLDMNDLSEATGIDVKNIKEFFASLDDGGRLDVLTVALEKFKGASKAVADSTSGDIQRIKDAWTFALQDIGEALVKAESGGSGFSGIVTVIKGVETAVLSLINLFREAATVIGGAAASIVNAVVGIGKAFTDTTWKQFFQDLKDGFSGASDSAKHSLDQIVQQYQETANKIDAIWSTHMHDATPDQYGAFNKQAAEDRTDAAAKAFVPKNLSAAAKEAEDSFKWLPSVSFEMAVLADQEKRAASELNAFVKAVASAGGTEEYLKKIADAMQEALNATPPATKAFMDFGDTTKSTQKMLDGLTQGILDNSKAVLSDTSYGQLSDALKKLGVDSDGLKAKLADELTTFEKVAKDQLSTLPQVEGAWNAVSAAVSKLAKDPGAFPAVIQAWNDYIAALQRVKAPIGEIIAAQEQLLQQTINNAKLTGQNVGDEAFQYEKLKIAQQELAASATQMSQGQIIALANMTMAVQAHRDSVNLLSDTYRKVQGDIVNAFQNLGKGFADAILSGQNFGKVITSVFSQLKKQILEDIIGNALKVLGERLVSLVTGGSSALSGLANALTGTAGNVGAAANKMADAASKLAASADKMLGAGAGVTDASGQMANSAKSMSSAASSTASSALGIINAVTGIVTAVASIGSFVTELHMSSQLSKIEGNTRISAILAQQTSDNLTSMHKEMYTRVGEILNGVFDVTSNLVHIMEGEANVFNRLGDIWQTLQHIYDSIGTLGTGSGGSGGGGPSGNPRQGGPPVTGGTATIGSAYIPTSDAVVAALGTLAQAVQELGAMEAQVSADVKRLAMEESLIAGIDTQMALAIKGLGGNISTALSADLTGLSMNEADVADHLQNISDGQASVGGELSDIANNVQEQTKIDTTGQLNFANAQAQANGTLNSLNNYAGEGLTAAQLTAASARMTATASDATATSSSLTTKYMGTATTATQAIVGGQIDLNATTDTVATNTASSADQLSQIVKELVYADKLLFLDKLVWLDKLDGIDKSAAAIYAAVTGVYTATTGGFAGIAKQLDAIEATLTAIEGKLTAAMASFPTVMPGIPPITGGLPPLGAVIINWDLSRQMQEEFGAAIAAYLAAHPPDSSNPNGPGSGVSPAAPHSFASAHSSPAIPFSFSATGAGLPSGPISTSSTVHIAAINIYDAQTPRQSADAIMRELSKRSPSFSQAATRTR